MKSETIIAAAIAVFFLGASVGSFPAFAEQGQTKEAKAENKGATAKKKATEEGKDSKKRGKKGNVTVVGTPGSKVTVEKDEDDDDEVGDVTVIADEGDVDVNLGAKKVEGNQGKKKIETHYKAGNVTTITGKKSKSSVNIGGVTVGK
jgi:hypothetical protein